MPRLRLFLSFILLLSFVSSAQAFDVSVSTESALNEQIRQFNLQTTGSHRIRLSANIVLTGELRSINNGFSGTTLTIESDSENILRSINGQGSHYLFFLTGNSRVVFNRITFENGNNTVGEGRGGAILVGSDVIVAVRNCYFKNNRAVGPGSFTTDGGAIYNRGNLTVFASTFEGNTAPDNGGAIANMVGSTANIVASTFYNNSVSNQFGRGGAIFTEAGASVDVSQSTFSGNAKSNLMSYTLNGLHMDGGSATLSSNLFADACVVESSPTITDLGKNLFPAAGSRSCGISNGVNGNILSGSPDLGFYGLFGGLTRTIPLLETSPAIDAGQIDFVNRSDQRGVTRNNDTPDIGAFEFIKEDQFEPNDTIKESTPVNEPRTLEQLTMEGSEDWFKVSLPANKEAIFTVTFKHILADIDIRLYDALESTAGASAGFSDTETISYTPTEAGDYFLRVQRWEGGSNPNGQTYYDLELDFEGGELCLPIKAANNNIAVVCL